MYYTICIPVYNRVTTIFRTLDSLKRQTFKDFEVILVDDGSTDYLKEAISDWTSQNYLNLIYIYKENGGKHTAINVGIENAQGQFFIILDSDDWLADNALECLHSLCEKISMDETYSGVMARCINSVDGKMIGDKFLKEPMISSYVDFHFVLAHQIRLGDCLECNKTNILKQYRFPEDKETKFVPEAWLFDQIGVKYKLYCTNDALEYKEYRTDGISKDIDYKNKNNIGFLYHYISRLENVLPYVQVPFKVRVIAWWRYWQSVKMDKLKKGPRCRKVTLLGILVRLVSPLITVIYKKKYRELYQAGR